MPLSAYLSVHVKCEGSISSHKYIPTEVPTPLVQVSTYRNPALVASSLSTTQSNFIYLKVQKYIMLINKSLRLLIVEALLLLTFFTASGLNTSIVAHSQANNVTSEGYVKCTLLLYSGEVMNGNFNNGSPFAFPYDIAYDPSNGYLYVTESYANNIVTVIDPANNTILTNITVGNQPEGITYDPSNGYLYVVDALSNNVSVIDPADNVVIANITVGNYPKGIAYDSSNGYLYVTDSGSVFVSVINPSADQVVGNISVGFLPNDIVYDPGNGYIYVTGSSATGYAYVSVVNPSTDKAITNISFGIPTTQGFPEGITYDPSNGYIYVTGICSVSTIDPHSNTIITHVNVPDNSRCLVYDPGNGYLYVTGYFPNDSGLVSVINPANNTVLTNIQVGKEPHGITYDPGNARLYVANKASGSIGIIATANVTGYEVTLVESGLPPNTPWSVTLNGVTKTSTTNTITFYLPNGAYTYTVSPVQGYTISQQSGTITVHDSQVTQQIIFTQVMTTGSQTSTTSQAQTSTTSQAQTSRTGLTATTTTAISTKIPITYIAIPIVILVVIVALVLLVRKR
ncbi:hypothetical protein HS7_13320 [Sulfolobales archaeon HS-7]|nr:hypothetical protein HS7_13320 [Sulfolobales archaeon HS-7]